MNSTLAYLRGRRAWMVENLSVWGSDSQAEFALAVCEAVGSDTRVGLWTISLGGQRQEVIFASLTDNRGNHLPATIKRPSIIVIPRGRHAAFVRSVDGETGFTIARSSEISGAVSVDVMIFETGI